MEDIASVETSFQGFSSIRNNSATDPPMTAVRLSEPVFFTYDLYGEIKIHVHTLKDKQKKKTFMLYTPTRIMVKNNRKNTQLINNK
jgi:hypothetical protein